jgi:hypothetical protein
VSGARLSGGAGLTLRTDPPAEAASEVRVLSLQGRLVIAECRHAEGQTLWLSMMGF